MLIITLVAFSISYLARFIWDSIYILNEYEWDPFVEEMLQLVLFLIFDFVPFVSIFAIHFRNFRESRIQTQ